MPHCRSPSVGFAILRIVRSISGCVGPTRHGRFHFGECAHHVSRSGSDAGGDKTLQALSGHASGPHSELNNF
jgi:hypothetical protein